MPFNFLNRICGQQPYTDINDLGTSVDEKEGNDFDDDSDIDVEEEDPGLGQDLDLDIDSDNEDQSIDLKSQSGDRVELVLFIEWIRFLKIPFSKSENIKRGNIVSMASVTSTRKE